MASSPPSFSVSVSSATMLRDEIAALLAQEAEAGDDAGARVRMQLGEGEVLELVLHPVHADALGERDIDVHRLARDAPALVVALDEMQRAHVVQPVGELDQQHADVLGHREHELAEILRLLGLVRLHFDARQLGDAVDQPGDLGAEQPLDVVERRDRVLDRVVQQAGNDRGGVELHLREQARDLDRMREIRVARGAQLRAVRLHANRHRRG